MFIFQNTAMSNIYFVKLHGVRNHMRSNQMGISSKIRNFVFKMNNKTKEIKAESIEKNAEKVRNGDFDCQLGDIIENNIEIRSKLGEGTFGQVFRCRELTSNKEFAIKIVKNVERYREASKLEIAALESLNRQDPNFEFPIVRLVQWFNMNGHICLCFPVMGLSIVFRKLNKKF